MKKKQLRETWYLGFLGVFGFMGLNAILNKDWWMASWFLWFIWFIYFVPVKKK